MGIKDKLLAIQSELKAPKGQYNDFGKYKYRSCEDILEAVKPLCKAHKAVLTLSDSIECVGGRNYVQATATLTDVDTTDAIMITAFAREEETKKGMDGSQITGAASSYARKYALNGLFSIDDAKDSDATYDNGTTPLPKKKEPAPPKAPPKKTRKQIVTEALEDSNLDNEDIKAYMVSKGFRSFDGMPDAEFDLLLYKIEGEGA